MRQQTAALKKEVEEKGSISSDNEILLGYINDTPALLSLLYDIDLMPEQCKEGSKEEHKMALIAAAWFKQEVKCDNAIGRIIEKMVGDEVQIFNWEGSMEKENDDLMYMAGAVYKQHALRLRREGEEEEIFPFSLVWAEGMIGVVPIFDSYEAAAKYSEKYASGDIITVSGKKVNDNEMGTEETGPE